MITIFSIPKPFRGEVSITQRNAIASWLLLEPRPEIILFGQDEGVAEIAKEFGIKHFPDVKRNEFGTPVLGSAFKIARKISKGDFLAYANCDIIFMNDLNSAIKKVDFPFFLMTGQRWDLDVKEPIDFSCPDWQEKIIEQKSQKGVLHGPSGIDYYVFPRNLEHNMPDFPVGRPGWDNWLFWRIRSQRIPVIDATRAITIVHQNHEYKHHPQGKKGVFSGKEAKINVKMAGGFSHFMTLRDADWVLDEGDLKKKKSLQSRLATFYPWRMALALKRRLSMLN